MADVIQIDHIRRARRLFTILLERLGIEYFVSASDAPRIDRARLYETLELCCEWISRRTGDRVPDVTREIMHRQFRRQLIHHIAESMVRAGY